MDFPISISPDWAIARPSVLSAQEGGAPSFAQRAFLEKAHHMVRDRNKLCLWVLQNRSNHIHIVDFDGLWGNLMIFGIGCTVYSLGKPNPSCQVQAGVAEEAPANCIAIVVEIRPYKWLLVFNQSLRHNHISGPPSAGLVEARDEHFQYIVYPSNIQSLLFSHPSMLLLVVKWGEMGMGQYLLIPFLGEWTSIYQLFWCSPGVITRFWHTARSEF